jgi:hypothetical protein
MLVIFSEFAIFFGSASMKKRVMKRGEETLVCLPMRTSDGCLCMHQTRTVTRAEDVLLIPIGFSSNFNNFL